MQATMPMPQPRTVERRSMPARTCGVCLDGVYVTRQETDANTGAGALQEIGIGLNEEHVQWHIESCDHCGHVQMFVRSRTRVQRD